MATDLKTAPEQQPSPPSGWVAPPPAGRGSSPASVRPDSPPIRPREIAAVVLTVVLFDLWIYRGAGFSGYAAFFLAACVLFLFGSPERFRRGSTVVVGSMVLLHAVRMFWLGTPWLAVVGFLLLVAF